VEHLGQKVFVLAGPDQVANEQADFFAHAFEKAGGAFVDRLTVSPGAAAVAVKAAAESGANVIYAALAGDQARDFLSAYTRNAAAAKIPLLGPESLAAFPKGFTGTVRTLGSLKKPEELTSKIKQKLNVTPTHPVAAAEGYEIGMLIAAAVKGAGPETKPPDVLAGLEITGPRGKLRFDKNHEPVFDVFVQAWSPAGGGYKFTIAKELGEADTPDFGCGKIGFPRRPDAEIKDDEPFWDDRSE
jgi:ABC-type branched-subunit amino acid transport system substrate-binding protein